MEHEDILMKAAKKIKDSCAAYGEGCYKMAGKTKLFCPYFDREIGCILKMRPEKWRLS